MNTWQQSPRPRQQPVQTREGSPTGLRPLWPKQGRQGQLVGEEVREASGAGHVAPSHWEGWATGRTLAFPLSEMAPQEG